MLYYVADAITGKATFRGGHRFFRISNGFVLKEPNNITSAIPAFPRQTNKDGIIILRPNDMPKNMHLAGNRYHRKPDVWHFWVFPVSGTPITLRHRIQPDQNPGYDRSPCLSSGPDRQDLRPGCGMPNMTRKIPQPLPAGVLAVRIHNPKNERIYSKTLTADAYGGIQGEFKLPLPMPPWGSIASPMEVAAVLTAARPFGWKNIKNPNLK